MTGVSLEELVLTPAGTEHPCLRSVARPLPGPAAGPGARSARILFLGELSVEEEVGRKIFDILLEVFEHGFSPAPRQQLQTPVSLFESGVGNVNQALSSLAAEGHVDWVGSLHLVLGLITNEGVHLAHTGDVRGFLLRDQQFIDVLRGQTTKNENPLKTFGNIISGNVDPGDRLLLATPQLFDFLSKEKIRRVLLASSLDMAKVEFETLLSPDSSSEGTLALLLLERPGDAPERAPVPQSPAAPQPLPREISPQGPPDINPPRLTKSKKTHDRKGKRGRVKLQTPVIAPNAQPPSSGSSVLLQKAQDGTMRTASAIKNMFSKGAASVQHVRNRKQKQPVTSSGTVRPQSGTVGNPKQLIPGLLYQVRRVFTRIQRLPRISQALLGAAVLLVIILSGSLIFGYSRQSSKQEAAVATETASTIEQDIKRASDMLLYQDEDGARMLIADVDQRISTELAAGVLTTEEADSLRALAKDAQNQLDRIFPLDDLSPAVVISDVEPLGLVKAGESRLFFSETDMYSADESGTVTLDASLPEDAGVTIAQAFQDGAGGNAVFIMSNNHFFGYDPDASVITSREGVTLQDPDIVSGALYNGNLYLLDRANNQISKHGRIGDGYGGGNAWIQSEGVDLSNATDIAIDGNILVLSSDGSVRRFLSGEEQDYSLAELSNPLTGAAFLATQIDNPRLVILDPATSRLVVYEKESGRLVAQYSADAFSGARDLFVNSSGSRATILTNDGLYEVEL